jgi:zinc D-Ala-D-Ala carboxypeptidase
MNLSDHFELSEFTHSETALRQNIKNDPDQQVIENLKLVCLKILEPTREHFKKPIIITSGYRSEALNRAIGGAAHSQHRSGQAVDFIIRGVGIRQIFDFIKNNLIFDQLIYEKHSWIHCSYNRHGNKNQSFDIL